jgi:hypothetical protein
MIKELLVLSANFLPKEKKLGSKDTFHFCVCVSVTLSAFELINSFTKFSGRSFQ